MQWEYHIREGNLDIHSLNYLGKEGWELVNVTPYQTIGQVGQNLLQFSSVFKRPLKDRLEETTTTPATTTHDQIAARGLAHFDRTSGRDGDWMR